MRQLVSDKKLAKTEEPNPRGQPFVYYHLPTLLERQRAIEDHKRKRPKKVTKSVKPKK